MIDSFAMFVSAFGVYFQAFAQRGGYILSHPFGELIFISIYCCFSHWLIVFQIWLRACFGAQRYEIFLTSASFESNLFISLSFGLSFGTP